MCFNGGGWTPFKLLAMQCSADIIVGQEHQLGGSRIEEASQWLFKRGWKSLFHSGKLTDSGGTSSGVFIAVREWLGIRWLQLPGLQPQHTDRLAVAVIDVSEQLTFALASVYLKVGVGAGDANLRILAHAGHVLQESRLPWLVAGDFNLDSTLLAETGWLQRARGYVLVTERPTCITKHRASHIDYMVASDTMLHQCGKPEVNMNHKPTPHRPITMAVRINLVGVHKDVLYQFQKLPSTPPVGPLPYLDPADWTPVAAAIAHVEARLHQFSPEEIESSYEAAHMSFVDQAEVEMAKVLGTRLMAPGARSQGPRVVKRRLVPAKPSQATWLAEFSRGARWLQHRMQEARGILHRQHTAVRVDNEGVGFRHQWTWLMDEVIENRPEQVMQHEALASSHTQLVDLLAAVLTDSSQGLLCSLWQQALQVLDKMLELIDTEVKHEEVQEVQSSSQRWSSWLDDALDGGCKRIHAWTRLPVMWQPTVVQTKAGVSTSAPDGMLEAEVRKLSALWDCTQEAPVWSADIVEALPDPSVAKVRAVARSFSSFSAVSPDGFHLNNYAQLSDDGVRCLIGILRIFEKVGRLPRRIRLLLTFLINKPKGGLRALGLFPSLYRLWARLRRGYMVDWEVKNQKPFFHLWENRLGH